MPPKDCNDIESGAVNLDGSPQNNNNNNNSTNKSRKSIKMKMKNMFKGGGKKRRSKNGEMLPLNDSQEIKTAGTFDTSTVTFDDSQYHHPRSPTRMVQKWGQLKKSIKPVSTSWTEKVFGSSSKDSEPLDPRKRATMVKEAQKEIRSSLEFKLWHCLVAISLYIAGTVYCFSFWLEPEWTIIDSVYFAVVTFTTIGYGDVVPDTRNARIFTCLWALSGVACLGIFLGVLGSELVEVAEQEQKMESSKQQSEVFEMFDIENVPRHVRSGEDEATTTSNWSDIGSYDAREYAMQFQDDDLEDDGPSPLAGCLSSPKTIRFFWLTLFMVVILLFMSQTEGWSMWTTVYYGLITACTVGYGDFSPATQTGRILAVLYIPVAVSVIGSLLDVMANTIIELRKERGQQEWRDKELTLNDLKVMDGDGDGTVTKAEYLEFMLVAMNQVDQDLLDNLKSHFDRLDKDKSGTLDKNDLINVAQYNLQKQRSSRRRLSSTFLS